MKETDMDRELQMSKNMGSTLEVFMKADRIFEQSQSQAVKEGVARQLAQAVRETRRRPARQEDAS